MCGRLFVNGDSKAKDKFVSLYLVLMRGDYDENIRWPFQAKVKLTILSHISSNYHWSKCFWPNIQSSSFQRPRSDMNDPYGISKFFPLNLLEPDQNHYVTDDTMCIKIDIDFIAKRPSEISNYIH